MASVDKSATVYTISESAPIANPAGGTIDTMSLGIVLGKDTPADHRVSFMVLASDYAALGSPGYGAAITVTLATA